MYKYYNTGFIKYTILVFVYKCYSTTIVFCKYQLDYRTTGTEIWPEPEPEPESTKFGRNRNRNRNFDRNLANPQKVRSGSSS